MVERALEYAIFMLDPLGQIVTWNAGADRIYGYRAEEIIGQHFSCSYPPEDVALGKPGRELETAIAEGRFEEEGWRARKDGSHFWAEAVLTALYDEIGHLTGFTSISRDLSERKRANESLRSVVNHVVDGIITIDERGTVESFNPAAERIFGYRAAEVLGRNVKLLMPEPYHGEHDTYLANYLNSGQPKIIGIGREVVGRRSDGTTFPMDLAVSEFHLGNRRFFTGIVRDITERKQLEQELRRRLSELAETDRRKDEFLAMLAHELRNPLAAISSAVQLTSCSHEQEHVEWGMEVINRHIKHLARLIDDLLDVSRITRGKIELRKEIVDVAPILKSAAEAMRASIDERKHELTVSVTAGTLWLEIDPMRLEQILVNLLSNATKYTENGGHIWLSAEREGKDILIRVRDTGIGISPEWLPEMFELFAQGDQSLARSGGGLGIGLTLARSLAEMHGGSVSASSAGPGMGSEFTVRLPAAEKPQAKTGQAGPTGPRGAGSRVLVVDDNVDLARGIARLLKLLGHNVQVVHDGRTAIEAARTFRPEVVLLDIGLPTMDGYQVARQLRREEFGKNARIIAITGYGHDEDRKRSHEAGFDTYLVKPIDFNSLMTLFAQSAS
jgi:PAS domain S-box-containing protein